MSFKEMTTLLESGGVDLSQYGTPGKKTLEDLHQEICKAENVPIRRRCGRIIRTAYSVRMAIVGGPHVMPTLRLREYKRVYGTTPVEKLQHWGYSGSRGRHELPIDALEREWEEETGLPFDALTDVESVFAYNARNRFYDDPERIVLESAYELYEEHPSSVYPGIWSGVWTRWYTGRLLPEFFRPEGFIAQERGYTVHSHWYPL